MKRVLDFNPETGLTTYFEHDAQNNKNIITYSQDIQAVVDHNKHCSDQLDKKSDYWYVGTLPDTVIMQWSKECGHRPFTKEWQEYARKQLDSAENRKFNQNKIRLVKRIKWE